MCAYTHLEMPRLKLTGQAFWGDEVRKVEVNVMTESEGTSTYVNDSCHSIRDLVVTFLVET